LQLAALSKETKEKLKPIVHMEGSVENPIDLLPGGNAEQFKMVNEIAANDENVDAVISIFVEPIMVPAFDVIENINNIVSEKPVFQVVMPLPEFWDIYRTQSKSKKPLFKNPEEPASVISNMLFYKKKLGRLDCLLPKSSGLSFKNYSGFADNEMINLILQKYKMPLIETVNVKRNMINKSADDFNYPLVLKGTAKNVVHKTELNAVKINIKNKKELLQAELEILNGFEEQKIFLEEFLIQPYIKAKHEILIGGFRDSSFGPMIMFGSGGKYVEVHNDTSIKSAYLSELDVEEIISKTKVGEILKGVRGEKKANITEIKNIIASSARMMLDNPSIVEFDFNPVIVGADNSISIVDARIKLEKIN